MKKLLKKIFYKFPSSYALMFHHIDNGQIEKKSNCSLRYESFLEILDSGLQFIDLAQHLTFSRATRGTCTITFDDGLSDVYHVAYPELKKRNIPFTIFVIADFLNKDGYLTIDELKSLASDPLVTIASHGMSHDVLKGMSSEKQRRELSDSKKILEGIIEKPVRQFAYSHGQYDDNTLCILRDEGYYDYAFGTAANPTNFYTRKNRFALPRLNCIDNNDRFIIVRSKGCVRIRII